MALAANTVLLLQYVIGREREFEVEPVTGHWQSPAFLHPGVAQDDAVHIRHQHVGDDGIGPVAPRGGQRFHTIAGSCHAVVIALDRHLEELAVRLAVVDDQNVSHETPFIYIPCRTQPHFPP